MKKNKIFSVSQKGFTLIEMLIVISIIAILATVVLSNFGTFRSSAYDSRRISDVQKIQSYLEVYYNGHSRNYPITQADWDAFYGSNVPNDPTTNDKYGYCADATGQSYILGALLDVGHEKNSYTYTAADQGISSCMSGTFNSPSLCDGASKWFCAKS